MHAPLILTQVLSLNGSVKLVRFPDALIDDGLYDLCIIDMLSVFKIFRLLPTAIKGEHTGYPEVDMRRANRITIKTDEPIPVYYDGELPVLKNPLEFTIELLPGKMETYY